MPESLPQKPPKSHIFESCFTHGFVIDGFRESCFAAEHEIPAVIIVRARKVVSERRLR